MDSKLRSHRKNVLRLPLPALAKRAGRSKGLISLIETGKHYPSPYTLPDLARAYRLPLRKLEQMLKGGRRGNKRVAPALNGCTQNTGP